MGKHSEDVCEECGKKEKDMTFSAFYVKKDGKKGALLCRKHDMIAVSKHVRGK